MQKITAKICVCQKKAVILQRGIVCAQMRRLVEFRAAGCCVGSFTRCALISVLRNIETNKQRK